MIRNNGFIHANDNGIRVHSGFNQLGHGLAFHYKAALSALWPWFEWHKWSHLLIESFAENNEVPVLGPASSGKSFCAAAYCLLNFYIWPNETTVLVSSTAKQMLELRIWGEIKNLHNRARELRDYLPGDISESRTMLCEGGEDGDAKDWRNGVVGVATKMGDVFVGISNYVGVKNQRIILAADEASLMARHFIEALANLEKGAKVRFQSIFLGNPKDTTDALGVAAEPHQSLGGWPGYSGEAITTTWRTRRGGLAVQLCGYDSPNYDYPRGVNPFKGIIKPEQIEKDLEYYGEGSLQFSMMNLGVMPSGISTRRVLDQTMGERGRVFEDVVWGDGKLTHILSLDAAYKGVGGDRTPLIHTAFGNDTEGKNILSFMAPIQLVPIDPQSKESVEDQIALFVRDYAIKAGIPPINVGFDSTGRGTLMSAFARLWSPDVVPVEFGGKPLDRKIQAGDSKTERDAYGKMVTALWWASHYTVAAGQLRNCPREAFEEGCLREWCVTKKHSLTGAPVIDVEPKEDTKKRLGRSPDLWDSFVVNLELARRRGFVIQVKNAGSAVNTRKLPDWLKKQQDARTAQRKRHQLEMA